MERAFIDRMEEFVAGCPMLVTYVPTSDGRELMRIETQHPQDKTKKAVSYVWPRSNQ